MWFLAVGGKMPTSPAESGSVALVRVGSFHLIALADNGELVVVDRRWRVVRVIGMDND